MAFGDARGGRSALSILTRRGKGGQDEVLLGSAEVIPTKAAYDLALIILHRARYGKGIRTIDLSIACYTITNTSVSRIPYTVDSPIIESAFRLLHR